MQKILYIIFLLINCIGFSQNLSMQNGTFNRCAPDQFFDSGSELGRYGSNENLTTTICPSNTDEFISLDFTNYSFDTENGNDILTIYDGSDSSSPILGSFSGNSSLGRISASSTNTSGCLTLNFKTNSSINRSGFAADILCRKRFSSSVVTINDSAFEESSYTLNQLVEDVLISGGCSAVDNFSSQVSGSPNDRQTKSYGYFKKGGAVNFPFEEGILLTTGRAFPAGNSFVPTAGGPGRLDFENGLSGDIDLQEALGQSDTFDATFVKFNFVPVTNNISFRYIMASEEYDGSSECNFADSFAFLLREVGTVPYTNLAVLPDGTPVSVTNINNAPLCATNRPFFEGYNIGETNYDGRTVVLTASAAVIPNKTYEIKLVVADQGDAKYDSAIFIEAGSFNLGGDLGNDLTIDAGTAGCGGNAVTLDTGAPTAVHTWFYAADPNMPNDKIEIIGENTSTINVEDPGIYSVDVMFAAGCSTSDAILVEFTSEIVANPAQDLMLCDTDGTMEFDLSDNDDDILGIQNGTNSNITYHLTERDAIDNRGALPNNYVDRTLSSQIVWARIATLDQRCFATTSFELQYNFLSINSTLSPIQMCDDDVDDGKTQFTLTDRNLEVIGTNNPADVTVSYHLTLDNANDDMPSLPDLYTNEIEDIQTIFVRLELNANPNCYHISTLDLEVFANPIANVTTPLRECDANVESVADEFTEFNLTEKETEITGGVPGVTVNYYERDADAQMQTGEITNPTQYTNTSIDGQPANPQTIYVAVTDTSTGCISYTAFKIEVLETPMPTPSDQIPELMRCDDNNPGDGREAFDLEENELLILNNETGNTVTYHETPEGAESGTSEIINNPTQYINTTIPQQKIYARVTNDITRCYKVVDFNISVNPLPNMVAVTNFLSCELNTDGFNSFNLKTKDEEVLDGLDPSEFTVSYHLNLADAQTPNNNLPDNYTNISNPQEIFVAITNNTTGCSMSGTRFNLEVEEAAAANSDMTPIFYSLCDDNMETDNDISNDSVQFDLSTQNTEVLDGQNPLRYIVSYYISQSAADLGTEPLPFLYENITNPQVIYARVDNNNLVVISIALDIAALTVDLDLNADGTIDTYDTDNNGIFDLLDVDGDGVSDGIDNNADGIFEFVDIDGDGSGDAVDLNNDGIFDNLQDDFICYDVAELTLQVNPLPQFQFDDTYILCFNTNGTEVSDPLILDTNLSEVEYSFDWSFNGTDLPAETGSTLMPNQGGTYRVIATNLTTGCVNDLDVGITEVLESEPPSLEVNLITQAFSGSNIIQATATGIGQYEYSLDGGPWQDSGTFTDVSAGIREITARDKNGCGIVSTSILVIDYPLYFTPNGDGNNDTWNIVGIGTQPSAKIYIFDRYGKLLKELSPIGDGWDGTFNGIALQNSDYWFRLIYNEPLTGERKEFNAHFTLKR